MFYKGFVKRAFDIFLSTLGIVVLIPIWVFLAVAIKLDDAGPVFFKQKRIAKNKNGEIQYFYILKYRSMKTTTPKDMPTHLLQNPEQYITRVGKILRKTSLDELPQIFNVFLGQMSLIGPRPALYNQEDLYFERAKHGANDVTPGITGWAQINGRDELAISVKAGLDGEYARILTAGGFAAFAFDCRVLFGTVLSVLKHEGVVEGGTGELANKEEKEKETVTK